MASSTPFQSFREVAEQVTQLSNIITNELESKSIPQPSFDTSSHPLPLLPAVQQARFGLIDAAMKLTQLAMGPQDFFMWNCFFTRYDVVLFGVLAHYDIAASVPLEGSISYDELAVKVGLHASRLYRFLRLARALQIFYEPKPGYVAHTAYSVLLVKQPLIRSYLKWSFEGSANVSRKIIESNNQYGDSQDVNEAAAALAYGVKYPETIWNFWEQDGEGEKKGWRMRMIEDCLQVSNNSPTFADAHIHAALDWDALGSATIVDVGGSNGHVAFELAKVHPKLNITVQDLPTVEAKFNATCPANLRSRVSYQSHNFFDPQPIKEADVYSLRVILHDWPDQKAIEIVRNLVAVMKPSSRIVLLESTTPEVGQIPGPLMHLLSCLDVEMMAMFNARERTLEDWKTLIKSADSRLTLEKSFTPLGSHLSILVFGFETSI